MLLKDRNPTVARKASPVLAAIGNASLLLLFILLVAENIRALLGVIGSGAILAALLYMLGLLGAGWFFGGRSREERGVLSLATAARNFGAALVPATALPDPKAAIMLIVSAIVCLVVSFAAAALIRRRTKGPW